jgi:hypothetical protein
MQHAEFRRLFGADPRRRDPEVLAHRAQCAECAKYADDLERVDAMVRGAMTGPATGGEALAPAPPPWEIERRRAAARSPLWRYALAASVLVALAVGGLWWTGHDRSTLIAEVVRHADRERNVMVPSEKRVGAVAVRRTLGAGGATLLADLPISIARTCRLRGNPAPHLVLQTSAGAVAVLLMQKQRFLTSHDFAREGYEGTIVPKGSHSIAVLGTSKAAVKQGAELVAAGIDWPKRPLPAPAPQKPAPPGVERPPPEPR